MIAHGISLYDPYGNGIIYSPTQKDPDMDFTALPRTVEFSRYVGRLSKRLWVRSHGVIPHATRWPKIAGTSKRFSRTHRLVAALDGVGTGGPNCRTTWATYRFGVFTGPFRQRAGS